VSDARELLAEYRDNAETLEDLRVRMMDALVVEYQEGGITQAEAAEILGVDAETVRNWMRAHGYRPRRRRTPEQMEASE